MLRRLAAAALLALLLAACGGDEPNADVALEEPSAPTTAASTPAPPTEAEPPAPPTETTIEAPSTDLPEAPPAEPPAATEGPAPETEPETDLETFELSLSGDGTEGGCSWGVDADEFFYDIVYPDGYEVGGSPVSVVGPDGAVVASEGQGMRVTGRLAPDREPSCATGTVLIAETVEPL